MRYLICFLIAAAFLLSPLRCQAQSSNTTKNGVQRQMTQDKDIIHLRVKIILKNRQKMVGEWLGWKENRVEILQKGIIRSIPEAEIAEIKYTESFWRKIKFALQLIAIAPLLPIIWVGMRRACRNGC